MLVIFEFERYRHHSQLLGIKKKQISKTRKVTTHAIKVHGNQNAMKQT